MKPCRQRRRRGCQRWVLLPLLLALASASGAGGFIIKPRSRSVSIGSRSTQQQAIGLTAATVGEQDDDAPHYAALGVSAYKGEVRAAVGTQEQQLPSLYPGAFCKVVPDVLTGSSDHALIMHSDGAGTKAALAYLYWKETGDMGVWKGIAQDALAMNLDDAFCCGATGPSLITSTIGRNRRLVPGEVVSALIRGLEEACAALRPWGVEVGVAGGETADIGDLVRTVTFDCALTTRMRRSDVVHNGRIRAGDLIVGLASFGQAAYEDGYNSGIGANGLTAARHDVLGERLAERYPESFDPGLPSALVYSGARGLTEPAPVHGLTVGQLLLSPARTYAPVLARLLGGGGGGGAGTTLLDREALHGLVHCSGGGQTKALRCLRPAAQGPLRLVKDALFDTPPVFRLIHAEQAMQQQQQQQQLWREMYQVFNMGHRLEAYVRDEQAAQVVIDVAAAFGIEARVVGRVEEGVKGATGHELVIRGPEGTFVYR